MRIFFKLLFKGGVAIIQEAAVVPTGRIACTKAEESRDYIARIVRSL